MRKIRKDSVSMTICIGRELFDALESFCATTGQSKTVAVERAIRAYCGRDDEDCGDADSGKDGGP